MTALVITSIVATGIVVAGLTATPEEPALTVQPVTPTPTEPLPPVEEYVVVYPEVEYPTTIPGCDTVDEPIEPQYSSYASNGEELYDNPVAPWFSGPKAHLMSAALVAALPADTTFSRNTVPYFGPIPMIEGSGEEDTVDSTSAYADISVDGKSGYFSVGVAQTARGVPSCVAGNLDERKSLPDGTVVDTDDTWREVNGARTYERSATAYRTDGSWITVYVSGADQQSELPLSLEEATRIALDPGLATTPAPPAGTPGNVAECTYGAATDSGRLYSASGTEVLNTALQRADTGALVPSPPLGALTTGSWAGGLCQLVDSAAGRLSVSFGDTPAPAAGDSDSVPLNPGSFGGGTSVSVTTPSGKGVTVETEQPWDPIDLERIASTPGLDLP